MSTASVANSRQTNGQQDTNHNRRLRVSLLFDERTSQTLREMCDEEVAQDITDAVVRLMSVGLQTKDQLDQGYTEVVFQNPKQDLARNVNFRHILFPSHNK